MKQATHKLRGVVGAVVGGSLGYLGTALASLFGLWMDKRDIQAVVVLSAWSGAFIGLVGLKGAMQAMADDWDEGPNGEKSSQ